MEGRRKTYTFAEAFAIITSDSGATVVPLESSSSDDWLAVAWTGHGQQWFRSSNSITWKVCNLCYWLLIDLVSNWRSIYLIRYYLSIDHPSHSTHSTHSLPVLFTLYLYLWYYLHQLSLSLFFVHSLFDTISILSSLYSLLHCWEDLANRT